MPDNEIPALDAIRLGSYAASMGITRFEALRLALSLLHAECERRKTAYLPGVGR